MSFYLSDKESTKDKLAYQDYVNAIAGLIKQPEMETPFTIGIFGPWGSGKSTMINLIVDSLKEEKNIYKVRFNPWLYKDEKDLLVPLFKTILESKDLNAPLKKIGEELGKLLAVSVISAGDYFLKNLITTTQKAGELYEKNDISHHANFDSVNFKTELRSKFQSIVNRLVSGNANNGKLVIFIDDLDRCNEDTIIDLLESLKLFLSVERCIFIICADYEVIKFGLKRKFNSIIGAEDYLEKLVQLPFFIPSLTEKQVKKFIREEIARKEGSFNSGTIELLTKFLPPIPRKIKRIVNMLSFQKELAKIRLGQDYSEELLLKTIILQQRFNNFFKYVDGVKEKLIDYEKGNKIPDIFDVPKDDAIILATLIKHKPFFEDVENIKKYFSLILVEKEIDVKEQLDNLEIINKTRHYLKTELGREPKLVELQNELGMPLDRLQIEIVSLQRELARKLKDYAIKDSKQTGRKGSVND